MNSSLRQTDYSINPIFTQRCSPRVFTGEPIKTETLMQFLEAARWAPSAYNSQPWRFIYAMNDGSPEWQSMFSPLIGKNKIWVEKASALVLFLAQKSWIPPNMDTEVDLPFNQFDLGCACMNFCLQATDLDWATHIIAGFDHKAMRHNLDIPELFLPLVLVAVGKSTEASLLSPEMQAMEKPSSRYPIKDLVTKGKFPA